MTSRRGLRRDDLEEPAYAGCQLLLLFIDPDGVSGRLGQTKLKQERPPPATGGIASLLDPSPARTAARQYELQAFGRLLAGRPPCRSREHQGPALAAPRGRERLGRSPPSWGKPFRRVRLLPGDVRCAGVFRERRCRSGRDGFAVRQTPTPRARGTHALDFRGAGPLPAPVCGRLYQREWRRGMPPPPRPSEETRRSPATSWSRDCSESTSGWRRAVHNGPVPSLGTRSSVSFAATASHHAGGFANETVRGAVGRAGRGKTCDTRKLGSSRDPLHMEQASSGSSKTGALPGGQAGTDAAPALESGAGPQACRPRELGPVSRR